MQSKRPKKGTWTSSVGTRSSWSQRRRSGKKVTDKSRLTQKPVVPTQKVTATYTNRRWWGTILNLSCSEISLEIKFENFCFYPARLGINENRQLTLFWFVISTSSVLWVYMFCAILFLRWCLSSFDYSLLFSSSDESPSSSSNWLLWLCSILEVSSADVSVLMLLGLSIKEINIS